jgi:hypothetical protein
MESGRDEAMRNEKKGGTKRGQEEGCKEEEEVDGYPAWARNKWKKV